MDCVEDGLAGVGELSEKGADDPSSLTVKTYILVSKTPTFLDKRILLTRSKFF